MEKYKIADMNVLINYPGKTTEKQGKKYLYNYEGEADIKLILKEDKLQQLYENYLEKNNYAEDQFSFEDFLYCLVGSGFSRKILEHNGCVLHSSAIAVDGYAYLFSAHCGTGKSTHTSLWLELFKERAVIINDDKPCIREVDGELYVYGTPWSGKNDISTNDKFKLKAITFICRSEKNWIKEITNVEAISLFLTQTYKPRDKKYMDLLLNMIDKIFSSIKVYKMGCNISKEAAKLSYEVMSKN